MAKITMNSPAELKDWIGKEIGASSWVSVTQDKINMFAEATGDHQWIHVDVERAKKESPFGGPIAHGYLTVSFLPMLLWEILEVKNTKLVVNYGLNKVRFPAPVPSGAKVRGVASVASVKDIGEGNIELELAMTIEIEGGQKPALVANVLYRYYA